MRRATILGVTGSIGQSTLDVLRWAGGREAVQLTAVTGHSNIKGLAEAAVEFGAEVAVTADPARYHDLRAALSGTGIEAAAGPEAVEEAASRTIWSHLLTLCLSLYASSFCSFHSLFRISKSYKLLPVL